MDKRADYLIQSKLHLIKELQNRNCHLKYMIMRTKQDLVDILYKLDMGMDVKKIESDYRIGSS